MKVGDKIRVKENTDWGRVEGLTGVVAAVDDKGPYLNITLDEIPEDLSGSGSFNWFMLEEEIELVEE